MPATIPTTPARLPASSPLGAAASAVQCAHCGLPLPAGVDIQATHAGHLRRYCCHGCLALAQVGPQAASAVPAGVAGPWALFDDPSRQRSWVVRAGARRAEVALVLEGVHCAACVETIRSRIGAMDGVYQIDVQLPGERARLAWDPLRQRLGAILEAIARLGYKAAPVDALAAAAARRREARRALLRLFIAGFGMMQVMMYAVPAYVTEDGIGEEHATLLRWASLVLAIPVVLYSAWPFFAGAWRDLRNGRPGMDVPVALGIGTAFTASAWATWIDHGEVYFDSVTMFVFFLLASRYFELRARQKASGAADALARQQPEIAVRLAEAGAGQGARPETVPVAAIRVGDRVLVRPGEVVPVDGRVVQGHGTLAESMLTGESSPVVRAEGAPVLAGSTLYSAEPDDQLHVVVEATGENTRLGEMVRLLDRALLDKPRLALIADRVAVWFTGGLLLLAALTALAWWLIDPSRIIAVTVAVLVVSCPCALSLATPSAVAAATGVLARRGLLVLRGRALETLAGATHVVFDKTGTLTSGRITMQRVEAFRDMPAEDCAAVAAALEAGSQHPAGQAIRLAARPGVAAHGVTRVPGSGVEGVVAGRRYRLGQPAYAQAMHGQPLPAAFAGARPDQTLVALADEAGWVAHFQLAGALRPGARELVDDLHGLGLQVLLLSGDRPATAQYWAAQLGIAAVEGGASPLRKRQVIQDLQHAGAVVVMVGDGANDTAALGVAHASIAVGSGARLAQQGADMVWLGDDLGHLDWAIHKSRKAMRIIRQNLWWAFGYNMTAIPLAVTGTIGPLIAGLGMSISSLLVVLNALRLLRESDNVPDLAPSAASPAPPGEPVRSHS
ncbi:MAG: heavy metal translocating P-type ATPase [Betaproteobacteria bacterium]|nr:heavy metal translocating P-type ATPase [Betaproteobacteria bacterium]